ncbi:MAG TPA: DEAD/DEAH box helicase, partial [Candidatus Saccharimonadales bacterium]|nr:DEAD/DEAH box helicase [Candidatus Saccharimonadales bacterium]
MTLRHDMMPEHYEGDALALGQETFATLPLQPWPQQWQPSTEFPTPQSATKDEFSRIANDGFSFSSETAMYRLGDPSLPVGPYREAFVTTALNNSRLVVSSETGSGKSSQLGLYLLEAGAPRVFITQPRILAARELTERCRQSLGPQYERLAGYLTGNADDSDCDPDARLIYVTEQLLFKMANRGELRPDDIVMNDEAHERTVPTVVLLGLMKELQQTTPGLKLIISSATIDTDRFARYLKDPQTGDSAPVMILPGRTHPIEVRNEDDDVASVVHSYMHQRRNVLAFEPGVARMRVTQAKVQSRKSNHTVHLLYGDQSPADQK